MEDEGKLLPTPQTVNRKSERAMRSSAADGGNGRRSGGGQSSPPGLEQVVERLLPTPTMMDGTRAGKELDPEHWERKRVEKAAKGINLHFHLSVAMPKLGLEQGDLAGGTSASSPASEDSTSPSRPSSATSRSPSSSGTSPVRRSSPRGGPGSPSTGTSDSSGPPLLPTPRAGKVTDEDPEAWRARQRDGKVATPPLSLAVKTAHETEPLLPTPTAQEYGTMSSGYRDAENPGVKRASLGHMVRNADEWLIPTPTVQQGRNATSGRQPGSRHHDGKTLNDWTWEVTGRVSGEAEGSVSSSSAEGSPARTSAPRGRGRGSRATGRRSSTSSLELSLSWSPDTSSWRTSEDSSPQPALFPQSEGRPWPRSSERWPTSATLTFDGSCWRLRTWEPPIDGSASSFSLVELLPTASARDRHDPPGMSLVGRNPDGSVRDRTDQLARRIYALDRGLLPTPTVGDFAKGRLTDGDTQSQNGLTNLIRVQLQRDDSLPTPTVSDANGTGPHGEGGSDLRTTVGSLLPTPNTMDHLGPRSPEAQEYQLRRGVEGGSRRSTTGNLREDVARLTSSELRPTSEPGEASAPPPTETGEPPTPASS